MIGHGDVLILSVKPQVVEKVLPDLKNYNKLLLSIAMGVPLSSLEKANIKNFNSVLMEYFKDTSTILLCARPISVMVNFRPYRMEHR